MTIEEYIEQRNVGKDSLEADSIREGYEFASKCFSWISVKDRLPEEGQRIFYTYAFESSYVSGSRRIYGEIYYPEQHITDMMDYWMPIPELPKACEVAHRMGFDGVADQIKKELED